MKAVFFGGLRILAMLALLAASILVVMELAGIPTGEDVPMAGPQRGHACLESNGWERYGEPGHSTLPTHRHEPAVEPVHAPI